MYNFCESITMAVVISQKDDRKWTYQVNFTFAIHICKDYFRCHDPDPPDITERIKSEILPIRPERRNRRNIIKEKDFVWFLYRVA